MYSRSFWWPDSFLWVHLILVLLEETVHTHGILSLGCPSSPNLQSSSIQQLTLLGKLSVISEWEVWDACCLPSYRGSTRLLSSVICAGDPGPDVHSKNQLSNVLFIDFYFYLPSYSLCLLWALFQNQPPARKFSQTLVSRREKTSKKTR